MAVVSAERVLVLDAKKDAPEPGQVMAEVLVGELRARCVVEPRQDCGATLIQLDSVFERRSNLWLAVYNVLGRIYDGEIISFPLDITAEVEQGPWPC